MTADELKAAAEALAARLRADLANLARIGRELLEMVEHCERR